MLVLVIGDFCIPQNKIEIPLKFKKLLVPGKINHALVTGQVSHSLKSFLDTICPSVLTSFSNSSSSFIKQTPILSKFQKHIVAEFEGWRFGLALSSSSLLLGDFNDEVGKEELARSLDAHVLITNGRHEFKAADRNGRFYLDPGSATGAWTIKNPCVDAIPSFVLMDVTPKQLTLYIYKLVQDQVKVEKMEFVKPIRPEE